VDESRKRVQSVSVYFVHCVVEDLVASERTGGVGDFCWDVVFSELVEDLADGQC